MFFHLDDRVNFSRIFFFCYQLCLDWSAWDISPWFHILGKALLNILSTRILDLVSDFF